MPAAPIPHGFPWETDPTRPCQQWRDNKVITPPITIGRTLKKNSLKSHLKEQWVIPPAANAAFAANMEDVPEVCTRPHAPDKPLVCLDETLRKVGVARGKRWQHNWTAMGPRHGGKVSISDSVRVISPEAFWILRWAGYMMISDSEI